MRGAAVEKDDLLALKLDRDCGNLARGPGTDTFGTQFIEFARVREDTQVELGSFFGVVVEPEERRNFVHGWKLYQPVGHFRQARFTLVNSRLVGKRTFRPDSTKLPDCRK